MFKEIKVFCKKALTCKGSWCLHNIQVFRWFRAFFSKNSQKNIKLQLKFELKSPKTAPKIIKYFNSIKMYSFKSNDNFSRRLNIWDVFVLVLQENFNILIFSYSKHFVSPTVNKITCKYILGIQISFKYFCYVEEITYYIFWNSWKLICSGREHRMKLIYGNINIWVFSGNTSLLW